MIETYVPECATHILISADIEKSARVVCNAKTRRVSVCNALDCLIIHKERLASLPDICLPLSEKGVMIYAGICLLTMRLEENTPTHCC